MGSILDVEDPEQLRARLIEFWQPKEVHMSLNHEWYTKIGSALGDSYARRLHDIEGMTYCQEDDHVEYYINDTSRGIAGKVDVILDFNKIQALGIKTPKELKEGEVKEVLEPLWVPNECKSTGSNRYKMWQTFSDLPDNYQNQLSLYCYYLFEDGIIKKKEGFFTLICRDDLRIKALWGEYRKDLVDRSFKCARLFWEHIQQRDFPEVKNHHTFTKDWVEDQIAKQLKAGRVFPKIAKV